MSGGVLGTVPLLLKCKARGSLGRLSDRLGTFVRTNSEALVAATSRRSDVDYSRGIAIASGFRPDDETAIEVDGPTIPNSNRAMARASQRSAP